MVSGREIWLDVWVGGVAWRGVERDTKESKGGREVVVRESTLYTYRTCLQHASKRKTPKPLSLFMEEKKTKPSLSYHGRISPAQS